MIVVKIGGSVAENAGNIIKALFETSEKILIVPGGWIFADTVRKLNLDDDTAHWMAVMSMNLYGLYLSRFAESIEPENFDFDFTGVKIILPYRLVRNFDELPHSWDVTSDSIAIWIAEKVGAKKILKVTNVDGIIINGKLVREIEADRLHFQTCLDRYSPLLLKRFRRDMFICNGLHVERIKNYITRGEALGTTVVGR